jgi:transcription elongation GreA/GreB family factor
MEDKVRDLAEARQALVGKEDLSSQQTLRELERELAYLNERVKRAVLVEPKAQPLDRVHFGALVEAEDKEGERLNFMIVGEDEADATQGRIS